MENNIKIIIYAICFFGLISCQEKKQTISINDNELKEKVEVKILKEFEPDSIINGILKLKNVESSIGFYPEINEVKLIDFMAESPVKLLLNNSSSEYLMLYNYEGDLENSFSYFEVGLINIEIKEKSVITNYDNFISQSGLKLGISFDDVKKIKGDNFTKTGNIVVYEISDYEKSKFLKRYNMPFYLLNLEFKDDILIKYSFGFSYP